MNKKAIITVLILVALAGVAGAQNATNTSTSSSSTSENTTYEGQLDPAVNVVSTDYQDGEMHVELEARTSRRLTITKSSDAMAEIASAGGGSIPEDAVVERRIPEGRTTLRIPAEPYRGVVIVILQSRYGGYGAFEDVGWLNPPDPPAWPGTLASMAATAVFGFSLVWWFRERRKDHEVLEERP